MKGKSVGIVVVVALLFAGKYVYDIWANEQWKREYGMR